MALFAEVWALWASAAVIGVGMAFMYPSLMALTVNRVDDRERPAAISSFTMFFEIGTVSGGLLLGVVAELAGKRASFAAAVVVCAAGLWLLRTRVAPATDPAPAACTGARPRLRLTVLTTLVPAERDQLDTESANSGRHDGHVELDLAARVPFDADHLMAFLAARAVPGIEAWDGQSFHRALDLPHGHGVAVLTPAASGFRADVRVVDERDLDEAVRRIRRLLDLDADPVTIDGALDGDAVLGPLVRRGPGLRVPGSVDPFETAVRAVVGQQISVAGARTVAGRIVAAAGTPLTIDGGPVTHVFPSPAALAGVDVESLPMPRSRGRTHRRAGRAGRPRRDRPRRRSRRRRGRAARRARRRAVDRRLRA